jgi:hypothetical protein
MTSATTTSRPARSGRPRGVSNDGTQAGGEALLDHLQARASAVPNTVNFAGA